MYEPVTSGELARNRTARPGVSAVLNTILFLFGARLRLRSGGIYNRRPVRGGTAWSLHAVGRAFDIMVPNTAAGAELFLRLIAAAQLLGICELIWHRQRWTQEHGVQPYHGENPHTDHLHAGFTRAFADQPYTDALCHWSAVALLR